MGVARAMKESQRVRKPRPEVSCAAAPNRIVTGASVIPAKHDYCTEVSDAYLDALQASLEKAKPANFKLTPISEPGW